MLRSIWKNLPMTPQDERLLRVLQAAGRISNQELAQAAGKSTSACWRRVRELEEDGTITGYAAMVDREKAGFTVSAILHVTLERHDARFVQDFVSAVAGKPEILDCFATTGDADYHLRVVVRDLAGYNRFLDEFMFRLPGIKTVRSNMILREVKAGVALPF